MDFGELISVAQRNAKNNPSSERSKFYSTKFDPPKKETKDKKLSAGIKKFLAQQEQEKKEENERKKKEYEELMALRTDRQKNKIKKMLKVTKSANRSVLEDAVNSTDTAVTLEGPDQPDEDDYGYTSHESSALYKNLMEKYKALPEDKKFSKSSMSGSKNADLMSTKNRVRDAITREREDERMGRKRSHTSISGDSVASPSDPKKTCRKNLYDPKAERDAEERKKKELEEERRQKMKNKRPPPPTMDFQKLLKLAAEKQHEPIQVDVPQKKTKEPERLLTSKEKRELEQKKKELEERERRRSGLMNKTSQSNGEQRSKPSDAPPTNGRIPKLNGSNAPSSTKSLPHSAPDRKPSMKEPIRPAAKPNSSIRPSTSTPQSNVKRPIDAKGKTNGTPQQSVSKPNSALKQPSKSIDARNVKSREFPPRDVAKTREFPPRDMVKSREFPPRDMIKSREFPPRDMQRSNMKSKQSSAASKRRILEDSEDEEEDSEMDDFIDDDDVDYNWSNEIKNIFGYDRSRYRDEDDDVDNMESSFAQQQREEFISKKIGMMEDLEDMRQEEEEKKRKAKKQRR